MEDGRTARGPATCLRHAFQKRPSSWSTNAARTSNDFCEKEQMHGLFNGTWTVLVGVIVLAGLVGGSEASSLGAWGAYRWSGFQVVLGLEGFCLLETRGGRMPSVCEREGARSGDTASGQPGGGTGGD